MPLTENERRILALLKVKGRLTVGQPVLHHSPRSLFLNGKNVHTGIARGLQRRGLVNLTRPDKRGPMVMTLAGFEGDNGSRT